MGAIDEISGDGKGAHLNGIHPNTPAEIAAATRYLTRHQAEDLIPILGLNPQEGEPR